MPNDSGESLTSHSVVKGVKSPSKTRAQFAFLLISALIGAAGILGFAPFNFYPAPLVALTCLFLIWRYSPSSWLCAIRGFAFGLGYFGSGVSWVYVSLHDFGGMPAILAGVATAIFCAYLALFPALAGVICGRFSSRSNVIWLFAVSSSWALSEWLRGWLLTGFPWLSIGYSQVPESPLAGYASLFGVYGISLVMALSAALVALLMSALPSLFGITKNGLVKCAPTPAKYCALTTLIVVFVWLVGAGLRHITWTEPAGAPFQVSLLQGNITQDIKWREDRVFLSLDTYRSLVMSTNARLIILPETALPIFQNQVPATFLNELSEHLQKNKADMLIGIPEYRPGADGNYFNSVFNFGTSPIQIYRKSHLVPFGEFIPFRPLLGWIPQVLKIPLSDFSRGSTTQRPLNAGGQRIAVNICYEDVFGEEIIRQLPDATLLVNVSNDGWFGRSLGPQQHLQIAQMRAVETGRMMVRATNTGVTAVISPTGKILARAPEFLVTVLNHPIQGYIGSTPYVLWGNIPAIGLCLFTLCFAWLAGRKPVK